MNYLIAGISHKNRRPTNQDSLCVEYRTIAGQSAILAIVCDGVGSCRDGELAGVIAIRRFRKWFASDLEERISATSADITGILINELDKVNREICMAARSENWQTGSTISLLLILETAYYILHLGDSRIYYCHNRELTLLTKDHTVQAARSKTALTQCLGRFDNIQPHVANGVLSPGASFLLCSDGLYKQQNIQEIAGHFERIHSSRRLHAVIRSVIRQVEAKGEKDNITLAIIQVKG